MSRRVFVNLIAFLGMFVLMLWWAINNIVTLDFIERPYEIRGEFAATVGVTGGSEVTYLGVNYGQVGSVESIPGGVMITMKIERGKEIPAGSTARIFRKSAIGEPYIDFVPPPDFAEGGPVVQKGDVIPLERTTVPLEFSELLRAASRVIGAVDPQQTRTLIHELALALNGRSDDLRALTTSSDALLATFAERTELLDSLSRNNTQLTRTITEHRGSLENSVEDLALLARSLAAADADTRILLDRGVELLDITADLVEDVDENLDCVLHDLDDLTKLTASPEQLDNLRFVLDNGPRGLGFVTAATDEEPDGLWVRVNLMTNPENPPEQYVPPTNLPDVPTVPPCVSTLRGNVSTAAGDGAIIAGLGVSTGTATPDTEPNNGALAALAFAATVAVGIPARRRARSDVPD